MGPATDDFPLQARYEVDVREELGAALGNARGAAPEEIQQSCRVAVTAHPVESELESLSEYLQQYGRPLAGTYVRAGLLGLEGVQDVSFKGDGVEFGHRLVLRRPAREIELGDGDRRLQPFTAEASYEIQRSRLCPAEGGDEHFLLEWLPSLPAGDSRTLNLRFEWRPLGAVPRIVLRECALRVPDELGLITRVTAGRFDPIGKQLVWRDLAFQGRALALAVSFENPVLSYQQLIRGSYNVELDGLVSGLQVDPANLWTAWGLKARPGDSIIRTGAVIKGSLALDPRRLSQEHEYVRTLRIACDARPDYRLLRKVTSVLVRDNVELLRVAQAAPRLNPAGSLDTRLHYWDIAGRRYDGQTLNALDVHLVISGHDRVALAKPSALDEPATEIDLRVRCLFDPRIRATRDSLDQWTAWVDEQQGGLAARIRDAIGADCI